MEIGYLTDEFTKFMRSQFVVHSSKYSKRNDKIAEYTIHEIECVYREVKPKRIVHKRHGHF